MVTSSKVLTVTYGTFSCTLEGFDDPFTTLQMVAEYFRKLAAEDRYFGGVPQVPDADALKRIAEENTPGTIAAEIAENGVILRQTDEAEAEVETEVVAEVEPVAEVEIVAATVAEVETEVVAATEIIAEIESENQTEEATAQVEIAEVEDETKLDETIGHDDDVAEQEALAAEVEAEAEIEVQASESETAEETVADAVVSETLTESVAETVVETIPESVVAEQSAPKAPASPVTFFRSRRHEEQAKEIATPDETTPDADTSDDDLTLNITPFTHRETKTLRSVEETLAAIRQNVERAETDAETDLEVKTDDAPEVDEYDGEDYDEDYDGDDTEAEGETGAADELERAQTSRDQPQDTPLSDPLVLTLDDQAEAPEVDVEAETPVASEVEEPEADELEGDGPEAEIETEAETVEIQTAETEPAVASSLNDEQEAELNRELAEALTFGSQSAGSDDDGAETAVTEEALAGEITEDTSEEFAAEVTAEVTAETVEETEKTADEIAEEIAATLNADMTQEHDDLRAPDLGEEPVEAPVNAMINEEEQRRLERRARADELRNSRGYADDDEALDRLLQTTQSKMDRPEQARRLNALEQLKAAVAATEAEAKLRTQTADDDAENDTTDLDTYREDLRRAQNKARLGGLISNTQPAPTPLILVSEQRIDEQPAALSEEPQSPQREVAQTDGNLALKPDPELENMDDDAGEIQGIPADAFSEATNFADFAERIGAFELQDLLEASAAYTSIIEGKSRFSRAQIMSKITKIDSNGAFTKEAGLRSFGRLLREGKILRVQDGQFAISKASRFSIASRFE